MYLSGTQLTFNRMNLQHYLAELTSGEDQRAEAAVQSLAKLEQHDALQVIAALQSIVDTAFTDSRWWALRALAEIPHPEIAPILARSLSDPDPSVRQCAALGLRMHPDPHVVPPLIHALNDPDALTADLAADALEAIAAEAVPALLEILQSGAQAARMKAVRALAVIGDTRAIPALYAALDEDSAWMEYWATEGLERMGVGMLFFKPL